jgi:hypothetical protein
MNTKLTEFRKNQPSVCNLIIIDNFYENPEEVRNFALLQMFEESKNDYPGKRTIPFLSEELKNKIQLIVEPFGGKIIKFSNNNNDDYNGCFQYATSCDKTWIHHDALEIGVLNWGGVIYLSPDAPLSSGTGFFKYIDGTMNSFEEKIIDSDCKKYSKDYSKWELVDKVGNIYNRLVLFNSSRFHASLDYFGKNKNDGRLFQVFFFTTKNN